MLIWMSVRSTPELLDGRREIGRGVHGSGYNGSGRSAQRSTEWFASYDELHALAQVS